MENKEYLQEKINDIETQIQELNNQLSTTQHELKVIGKPIINQNIYVDSTHSLYLLLNI